MCSQLARNRPGFEEALLSIAGRRRDISIRVQQYAYNSPGATLVGVHIDRVQLGEDPTEDAMRAALAEPLRLSEACPREICLILVDGLDEAELYSGAVNIRKLLLGLGDIPSHVRFIVTSRPNRAIERDFLSVGSTCLDLDCGEVSSTSLRDFLEHAVAEPEISIRVDPSWNAGALVQALFDNRDRIFLSHLARSMCCAQPRL